MSGRKELKLDNRLELLESNDPLLTYAIGNGVLKGFSLIALDKLRVVGDGYRYRYLLLGGKDEAKDNSNKVIYLNSNMEEITSVALSYTRFVDEVAVEAKVVGDKFYFRTNYGNTYYKTFRYTANGISLSSKSTSIGVGVSSLNGDVSSSIMVLNSENIIGAGDERRVRYITSEKRGQDKSIPQSILPIVSLSKTYGIQMTASRVSYENDAVKIPMSYINTSVAPSAIKSFFLNKINWKTSKGGWAGDGSLGKILDTKGSGSRTFKANLVLPKSSTLRKTLSFSVKPIEGKRTAIILEDPVGIFNVFEKGKGLDTPSSDGVLSFVEKKAMEAMLYGENNSLLFTNYKDNYEGFVDAESLSDFGNVFIQAPLVIGTDPVN